MRLNHHGCFHNSTKAGSNEVPEDCYYRSANFMRMVQIITHSIHLSLYLLSTKFTLLSPKSLDVATAMPR